MVRLLGKNAASRKARLMQILVKYKVKVERPEFERFRSRINDRYYTLSIDKNFDSKLGGMVVFYERRIEERQSKKGKPVKVEVRNIVQ